MKRTSKKGLLALLSVTLLAAAMYGGYLLGRSTLPVTIVRPHTREIFFLVLLALAALSQDHRTQTAIAL